MAEATPRVTARLAGLRGRVGRRVGRPVRRAGHGARPGDGHGRQRPRSSSPRPRPRDPARSRPPSCRGPALVPRPRGPPASPSRTPIPCSPARRPSCGAPRWPSTVTCGGRRTCRARRGVRRPTRAGACGAMRRRPWSRSPSSASCSSAVTCCACPRVRSLATPDPRLPRSPLAARARRPRSWLRWTHRSRLILRPDHADPGSHRDAGAGDGPGGRADATPHRGPHARSHATPHPEADAETHAEAHAEPTPKPTPSLDPAFVLRHLHARRAHPGHLHGGGDQGRHGELPVADQRRRRDVSARR